MNLPRRRARLVSLLAATGLVTGLLVGPGAALAFGPATALQFQTQPGGGQANVTWIQQPVVKVVDSAGDTVLTSTASVTLAIGNNPGGGTLICASGLTVQASAGVAQFTGCSISSSGPAYTLIATAPGLSAVTSAPFDLGLPPPPSPNHLAFAVGSVNPPPLTGVAAGPLNFQFDVRVLDTNNQVVTGGTASIAAITLGMAPNQVGATVSCASGLTVTAVAGIAQFSGCSVSAPGTGLAFVATSPTVAQGATSPTFTVLAGGPNPSLTISPSATVILWGAAVDLTIQLLAPATSSASVANRKIRVETATVHADGAFAQIAELTTDATGRATLLGYTPPTNRWYRAVFDGAADLALATSPDTRVVVRQLAAIRPDNGDAVRAIAKGTEIEFTTTARPSRDDIPRTHVKWQVWRLVNDRWTLFLTQLSDPDVSGRAFLSVAFNTGSWYVRSQAMPTQLNANSVWTPPVRFVVT